MYLSKNRIRTLRILEPWRQDHSRKNDSRTTRLNHSGAKNKEDKYTMQLHPYTQAAVVRGVLAADLI